MTMTAATASLSPPASSPNYSQKALTPPTSEFKPLLTTAAATAGSELAEASSQTNPQPVGPSPLESQRVTALLNLNRVLLQEVVNLQGAGRAGIPAELDPKPDGEASTAGPKGQPAARVVASKEYIE